MSLLECSGLVGSEAFRQVSSAEEIPDGAGARVGMFSARFDRGPTETLFRGVYQILKEKNYPVLMVDAAAGKNFGKMTAAYLGKLEDEKGVLLAVCTSHYAEITDSAYSSFEELKLAHENRLDILPLRVCDDPLAPETPLRPRAPARQDGEGAGLLRLAIGKATVFVDCRGKDEIYIAARIARRFYRVDLGALERQGTRQLKFKAWYFKHSDSVAHYLRLRTGRVLYLSWHAIGFGTLQVCSACDFRCLLYRSHIHSSPHRRKPEP